MYADDDNEYDMEVNTTELSSQVYEGFFIAQSGFEWNTDKESKNNLFD